MRVTIESSRLAVKARSRCVDRVAAPGGERTAEGGRACRCEEFWRGCRDRRDHQGSQREREVLTGIEPVAVKIPRVRDRTSGDQVAVESKLVPNYCAGLPSANAVLPCCTCPGSRRPRLDRHATQWWAQRRPMMGSLSAESARGGS